MIGNGHHEVVRDALLRVDLWPETVAIVVNVPIPVSMSFLSEIRRALNRRGRADVLIIQKMPGTSVDTLSVEDMRRVGWVRIQDPIPAPISPASPKRQSIFERLKAVFRKGDRMPDG